MVCQHGPATPSPSSSPRRSSAASPSTRLLWGDLKYLGICALPPAFFAFAASFSGHRRWLTRRTLTLLVLEPVAIVALLIIPATHDLVRYVPSPTGPHPADTVVASGPLFWPHMAYSNLVLWASVVLLVATLARADRRNPWQAVVVIGLQLVPLACNIAFNLSLGPFGQVDLTPSGFLVASIGLLLAMLRPPLGPPLRR